MKSILIICVAAVLAFPAFGQAPGFRYGGHFGIGTSDFKPTDGLQTSPNLALSVGLATNKQFTKIIGLDVNVLLVQKGAKAKGVIYDNPGLLTYEPFYYTDNYRLFYAEIPIMGTLSAGFGDVFVKVFGGPSFNFHLYDNQERTYEDKNYNNKYSFSGKLPGSQVMEIAFNYGVRLDVQPKSQNIYYLDFRMSRGQTSFNKVEGQNAVNNYFTIGLGYLYKYE